MQDKNLDQTRAPIYEALQEFKKVRVVPFDVPGHKHGRGNPELAEFLGEKCVSVDVNSMKPLDNLCHPVSVIHEAEMLAAEAFGAAHAFLMVGGTTSSVQSMVLSSCKRGDKIILPRNVHRSVINALVICGAIPVYVNPEVDHKLGKTVDERAFSDVRNAHDHGTELSALHALFLITLQTVSAKTARSGSDGGNAFTRSAIVKNTFSALRGVIFFPLLRCGGVGKRSFA